MQVTDEPFSTYPFQFGERYIKKEVQEKERTYCSIIQKEKEVDGIWAYNKQGWECLFVDWSLKKLNTIGIRIVKQQQGVS